MNQYVCVIGQAETPEGGAGQAQQMPNFWQSPIPLIVGLFFLWYFMVIRPGSKQREEMAKALSKLERNDKVLTQSGIYGFVVSVREGEDEMVIKTGDGEPASRLTISKSTIARVIRANESAGPEKK